MGSNEQPQVYTFTIGHNGYYQCSEPGRNEGEYIWLGDYNVRVAALLNALDVMLDNAQSLRIQQVQATAKWEQEYKDKANAAWKAINDAHRDAVEGNAHSASGVTSIAAVCATCDHVYKWHFESDRLPSGRTGCGHPACECSAFVGTDSASAQATTGSTISHRDLELLCHDIKCRFRANVAPREYDKADLLADMEAFLQTQGVTVTPQVTTSEVDRLG